MFPRDDVACTTRLGIARGAAPIAPSEEPKVEKAKVEPNKEIETKVEEAKKESETKEEVHGPLAAPSDGNTNGGIYPSFDARYWWLVFLLC